VNYLAYLREKVPSLNKYDDEELIPFLPRIDPEKFGGMTPDGLRYAATTDDTQFTKGLLASKDQMQAMGGGLMGIAGDVLGIDSMKESGIETYQRNMEEAGQYRPNSTFTDIDGVEDAMDWAGYTLGNLLPSMATAAASGGFGGMLAKAGVKKAAASMMRKKLAEGMTKEAADKAVGTMVAKHVAAGQLGGAFAATSGMETGSIYGDTQDAGVSLVHGAVAGALDVVYPVALLKKFGLSRAIEESATKALSSGANKPLLQQILSGSMTEGVTEGLQSFVEQHAKYWVENEGASLLADLDAVDRHEIIESVAAGALGGAAFSTVGGVLTKTPLDDAEDRIKRAGEDAAARGEDALGQQLGELDVAVDVIPDAVASEADALKTELDEIYEPFPLDSEVTPEDLRIRRQINDTPTDRDINASDLGISFPDRPLPESGPLPGPRPAFESAIQTEDRTADELGKQLPEQNTYPERTVRPGEIPAEGTAAIRRAVRGRLDDAPGDEIIARRLGFDTDEARLRVAQRLWKAADKAEAEGKKQKSVSMRKRADDIYTDVTGRQPKPADGVIEGELTDDDARPGTGVGRANPNFTMVDEVMEGEVVDRKIDRPERLTYTRVEGEPTVRSNGKPYKTEAAAAMAAKHRINRGDIEGFDGVVPVGDGFGYQATRKVSEIEADSRASKEAVEQSERQAARDQLEKEASPYEGRKLSEVPTDELDLLDAIARHGGLNRREAKAQGIDPAEFEGNRPGNTRRTGPLNAWRENGHDFESMAQKLIQDGFQFPNDEYGANGLLELLDQHLGGSRVFGTKGMDKYAARQFAERDLDMMDQEDAEAQFGQSVTEIETEIEASKTEQVQTDRLAEYDDAFQGGEYTATDAALAELYAEYEESGLDMPDISHNPITDEELSALATEMRKTLNKQKGVADEEAFTSEEVSVESGESNAGGQTAKSQAIRGETINGEWTAFSEESGTLNIPRDQMPQVKAEHRGALANFLKGRGIQSEEKTVPAERLKPTQAEFSEAKVKTATEFEGGDRAILVSSDGHVLDGHHQWLSKLDADGFVRVIELDAPTEQLLNDIKEFPSSETDLAGEVDATAQAISDAKIEKDKARSGTVDVPPDTGGGLFSNELNQTDLVEAAKQSEEPAKTFDKNTPISEYKQGQTLSTDDYFSPEATEQREIHREKLRAHIEDTDAPNLFREPHPTDSRGDNYFRVEAIGEGRYKVEYWSDGELSNTTTHDSLRRVFQHYGNGRSFTQIITQAEFDGGVGTKTKKASEIEFTQEATDWWSSATPADRGALLDAAGATDPAKVDKKFTITKAKAAASSDINEISMAHALQVIDYLKENPLPGSAATGVSAPVGGKPLSEVTLTEKVEIENADGTIEEVELSESAETAIRRINKRIDVVEQLRACVGG
jgi:uncharacterized protein YidB (DUF937 family)